ncbi:hypothetical protein WJX81_003122 [Elliptochloris bilobata]|uniref:Ubiquitin receptor RAD23 n=1 Tax=Elliptochloris bilobata TaxID=381761 RepID=A0AAW1RBZ2_9CHLO
MKVTFKTVTGANFSLEVEGCSKVSAVKQTIEEQQGATFPAASQVIIYQGKVLKDDTTLADNGVSETGFMVVMVTKAKAPALKAEAAPAPAAAAAPAAELAEAQPAPAAPAAPAVPAAAAPEPAATAGAAGTADAYSATASQLSVGAALENHINQICEMGFDREEVKRAMRAAFNNPDRAVDYLMNGIPESAEPPPPVTAGPAAAVGGAASAPAPGAAPAGAEPAPVQSGPNAQPLDMFAPQPAGAAGGGQAGPLDFLRANPQFQALRAIVQSHPAILQPMLQELGKQNPELLSLINSNQAEFLRLINEPAPPGGEVSGGDLAAQLGGQLGGQLGEMLGAGAGGEGGLPPGTVAVQLSEEEQAAVARLEAMGFDRQAVLEAFLACDRNETMAANFLLENAGDDM